MFGGAKIKVDKRLLERLRKVSQIAGYSTPEEFVNHVLERELKKLEGSSSSDEEIKKKLQGLGYIN
ncbi:MAG: hypothetical protein AB1486_08440 [Planctomycetota bacterium]